MREIKNLFLLALKEFFETVGFDSNLVSVTKFNGKCPFKYFCWINTINTPIDGFWNMYSNYDLKRMVIPRPAKIIFRLQLKLLSIHSSENGRES